MAHVQKNSEIIALPSPDYLVIGHVTADLIDSSVFLGGTATFSALTSDALGMRPGIITSCAEDLDLSPLKGFWLSNHFSAYSTTFENHSNGVERIQFLYHTAHPLGLENLPVFTTTPKIVHLGPVANEVDPSILDKFPNSLKCMTPQGWFRRVDTSHCVHLHSWDGAEAFLSKADIAVISEEDVQYDEGYIAKLANIIQILVVTENYKGARVYWHNDARFIKAPAVKYVDDTGAGDIFATAFFCRYLATKDPWEAGRFATLLASWSVTRNYLDSIPLPEEIARAKTELLNA